MAHSKLITELNQACKQVETAKEAVLQDEFDDLDDGRAFMVEPSPTG